MRWTTAREGSGLAGQLVEATGDHERLSVLVELALACGFEVGYRSFEGPPKPLACCVEATACSRTSEPGLDLHPITQHEPAHDHSAVIDADWDRMSTLRAISDDFARGNSLIQPNSDAVTLAGVRR